MANINIPTQYVVVELPRGQVMSGPFNSRSAAESELDELEEDVGEMFEIEEW